MFKSRLFLALCCTVMLVAGCGSANRISYDTPQEAFGKGKVLYEEGKYTAAITYFQGVFSFGRTHQWAADAQLYLARAYRDNKEYLLASNEYERFTKIYRADPRLARVNFERAETFAQMSPAPALDQSDTKRAIQEFQLFIDRFPNDDLIGEAQEQVVALRTKLAEKQFLTAQLYERRELFEAAALSFESVFDLYPDTPWAQPALVGAIKMYIAFSDQSIALRQPERLRSAIKNYDRLIQIFEPSEHHKEAESYYEQAQAKLKALQDADAAKDAAMKTASTEAAESTEN
ncbi:MAG: outer membrane protein assembly factor BamD [Bacteroidota bacterium]